MAKNPEEMKSGETDLPVVMTWIGEPELCLTKEDAAKRRPPSNSSLPIAYDRIVVSPRDLANLESDLASAKSDDAGGHAKPAPKPVHDD
ncbi:MAG: hypothetical protein OXI77_07525 [Chloroflexota bacterium]|nr:hypothetical protein [Chloroflexota bacterium]MDE2908576.1 hypothetical protein [Chloroflexota bacterium]